MCYSAEVNSNTICIQSEINVKTVIVGTEILKVLCFFFSLAPRSRSSMTTNQSVPKTAGVKPAHNINK
jgi:hypothetical protein